MNISAKNIKCKLALTYKLPTVLLTFFTQWLGLAMHITWLRLRERLWSGLTEKNLLEKKSLHCRHNTFTNL